MDYLAGVAWGNKQEADLYDCYYYYHSSTAKINDPRAIIIHRPGNSNHDWEANFYPYVPITYNTLPMIVTNEPDNNAINPTGEPAGDNLTPEETIGFVINAIRRYPKAWLVGPNIVRQDSWLDEFLMLWNKHGKPLTGRNSPFTNPQGLSCWACHIYGNGINYAKDYLTWFTNKVESFGHTINYLWVSEYGTKKTNEIEQWTRYFKNYNKYPLWYAVFAPYLKNNQELISAYFRGRNV